MLFVNLFFVSLLKWIKIGVMPLLFTLSSRRFYKNHFKDSIRQCCLDLMHGNSLDELELLDCWTYLRICGNIASEFLPSEPPTYIPHIALAPEFELANALYYMTRLVPVRKVARLKKYCI